MNGQSHLKRRPEAILQRGPVQTPLPPIRRALIQLTPIRLALALGLAALLPLGWLAPAAALAQAPAQPPAQNSVLVLRPAPQPGLPPLLAEFAASGIEQAGRRATVAPPPTAPCQDDPCAALAGRRLAAQEVVWLRATPLDGSWMVEIRRVESASGALLDQTEAQVMGGQMAGSQVALLEQTKLLAARLYGQSRAGGYFGQEVYLYYNTALPAIMGQGYYDVSAFYTLHGSRKGEGGWTTTQAVVGLHTDRRKTSDDYDDYNEVFYGAFYGNRYYLAAQDFTGPGIGWLVSIGMWDEKGIRTDWADSGSAYSAVFDLFWDIRWGPLWIEPTAILSVDQRATFAATFIPGLRVGLAF